MVFPLRNEPARSPIAGPPWGPVYCSGKALAIARNSKLTVTGRLSSRSPGQAPIPATRAEAETLALGALAWVLGDDTRRDRFLALTGLSPATLRSNLGNGAVLGAVLDFLANNEADLVAAAAAIAMSPEAVVAAWEILR